MLLSVSCATWFESSAGQDEQRAYDAAQAALETGLDPGRAAFESFLARYPDGALAPDAALALGKIALRQGDPEAAARRYTEAVKGGGRAADRARVQLATLELERGNAAAARGWLGQVRLSRLEDAELRNAYRALAESASRPAERVRWLLSLREAVRDPEEVALVDQEIDALLTTLPAQELEVATRYAGNRPPAGHIYVALAERALAAGDLEAARTALDAARRKPLAPRYAPRLAAVDARLRAREAAPIDIAELPTFQRVMDRPYPDVSAARGTLGVVLPLRGPFARFGEAALQGVLLAAGTFPEADTARPKMRVVVRDSRGDPDRAAAAVRELAADRDVVAIVGPLVSAECEAAAGEAQSLGVPLLALTARESVTHERDWVFRVRTRPIEEAELVAGRAIALGARRFAILYRDDPYGLGLRSLFWDAVEARGGRVVGVAAYDPKATDFRDAIRRLVGYTLLDDEEKRVVAARDAMLDKARRLGPAAARAQRERARALTTRDGRPIPPIVDFDALFIPESHENIVLIAPQLAFHEVTGIRLLGTDGWYDESLVRLAGEHIEGALFAAHFFPESPVPYISAFRQRFEATFGATPDAFAAQSYDAARLVLLQLAKRRDDREGVRDGLLHTEAFPGVSGVFGMRADGNALKRPFLLGVERGHVLHYID